MDVEEIVRDRSDRDVEDLVRCAVEGLRPRWREVIELRFYLGLSVEATAEKLGVHRDAAKALQWRAVNHLRHIFNDTDGVNVEVRGVA